MSNKCGVCKVARVLVRAATCFPGALSAAFSVNWGIWGKAKKEAFALLGVAAGEEPGALGAVSCTCGCGAALSAWQIAINIAACLMAVGVGPGDPSRTHPRPPSAPTADR